MKKLLLGALGAAVYYLITVLALYILVLLFRDSFENIWVSAVPVTLISGALLGGVFLWKKKK